MVQPGIPWSFNKIFGTCWGLEPAQNPGRTRKSLMHDLAPAYAFAFTAEAGCAKVTAGSRSSERRPGLDFCVRERADDFLSQVDLFCMYTRYLGEHFKKVFCHAGDAAYAFCSRLDAGDWPVGG
jgi:hypothetical protein